MSAQRGPQFMRPSLLGTGFALLVQFLLGMVVNLFVEIPKHHPGANPRGYLVGSAQSIAWAVTQEWPWVALHVILGLGLAIGGLTFLRRAWLAGQRNVFIACTVGALGALVAAFNGASFLNYNDDVSSYIMAAGFAVAVGSYLVALYLARPEL